MKKILVMTAVLALMGCAEKKPLTPEEQWQGYCRSVGNAARTIMLDRQNAIEKEINGIDVALLGPQVGYTLAKSKAICDAQGVKIDVIPMADYGMLDGEKVLDLALNLVAN